MSFNKNTQFNRMRKPAKRVLVGETPEEEAARLAREIAAHPVTKCEPGERNPVSVAPGLEQQAVHSACGPDHRRGHRQEDDEEELVPSGSLGHIGTLLAWQSANTLAAPA